jgi:DNA-binding NarL/FixJ family response regulator
LPFLPKHEKLRNVAERFPGMFWRLKSLKGCKTTMMADIRILVVDDQHLVRLGLVHILRDIPGLVVVGEAENGEQALLKVAALAGGQGAPDVVLMDLRMPGIGGLEATRKLTQRYPDTRVIAVTACDENPFPQRFLDSGALGFITKDSGIDEMVRAIHTVSRGKRYLGQQIAQDMALYHVKSRVKGQAQGQKQQAPFEALSGRELQIALMVMDGIKTSEIAERLHVSPKSVNTYRYRLFEKLDIRSNMELALLAARHGLLVADEKK